MTILELCFDIDRITGYDSYDKNYDYWSVDENGTFLFMNYRKNSDFLINDSRFHPDDMESYISYIWKNVDQDKPLFIPYEELKSFEEISIEFESGCFVDYESSVKYPLVCVRGICDMQCGKKDIKPYCFHSLPCFNNRPDWNVFSNKYPNFFDLVFSIVEWIQECKKVDALVAMFDCIPVYHETGLDFRYCTTLLIHHNSIKVTNNSKEIYNEYNKKYPTEDRQIESSLSSPKDDFQFKF